MDDGLVELAKRLGLSPDAVTRARALLKAWKEKDAQERAQIGTIYSDPDRLLRKAAAAAFMENPNAPLTSDERAMAARFGLSEMAFRESKRRRLQSER